MTYWTTTLVATMAGLGLLGAACSSDDNAKSATTAAADASGAGGKGQGGQQGTGGRAQSGGASNGGGAGGAGDAAPQCSVAVGVPCDGAEDCPSSQQCCGKWDQEYIEFGCFDSCAALAGDAGQAMWFQLCHVGDTCDDTTYQCLTSSYLPTSLSRCYDTGQPPAATLGKGAGEINCGGATCGSGEKCCLRGDFTPYCAPSSAECACAVTPAADAGPEAAPADGSTGQPDAPSADAAPDAPQD